MIIWSGKGIFSILILLLILFILISILPDNYSEYGFIFSFFISGIIVFILGNKWNKNNGKIYIEEDTNKRILIKNNHTLFWLPVQ